MDLFIPYKSIKEKHPTSSILVDESGTVAGVQAG